MELLATDIAHVVHEVNRVLQRYNGDPAVSPSWWEAPASQRDSAVNGVHRALAGATPQELHEEWVRWRREHGWVYGPVKDERNRTHPCLVAYDQLPEEQRVKDELFVVIVRTLAKHLMAEEAPVSG